MVLHSERVFNSVLIPPMITVCSVVLSSDLNFLLCNQNLNQTLIRILKQINRPWITALNAVPSKIQQCLKFFYEGKVVKLQPYQKECSNSSIKNDKLLLSIQDHISLKSPPVDEWKMMTKVGCQMSKSLDVRLQRRLHRPKDHFVKRSLCLL